MKDTVIHAAKLWNSLNLDKVQQEIREEREKKKKFFQPNHK
jgi:hypothetical protein